jgi:hypothetical protein
MQRPDLNRLQKTITTAREKQSLNNCPQERATHEEIAKPNGFFSPKIEERRILSSWRNKGRAVRRHLPTAYAHTTITSKSPSEAVYILLEVLLKPGSP